MIISNMQTIEIEGIVIGSIAYKETSKIVYLYTEHGRISVRALGSLRQKKGMLPLVTTMNRLECIMTDREFPNAIDYTLIDSYDVIKSDLKRNLWASFMLEIVSKLTEDSPHDRIYPMLKRSLELLKDNDPLSVGVMFQLKMLYGFGVAPSLRKCVKCGSMDVVSFSIKSGGALCQNHNEAGSYDKNELEEIRRVYLFDIYNGSMDDISDIDFLKLFRLVNIYYENHIHINLKALSSLIF